MIDFFITLNPAIQGLIATIFTWLVTLLGASLVFFFKDLNRFVMDIMLGLAGGVMIAASFWSLLNPAIIYAEELNMISWLVVALGFFAGGMLLFLGDKLFSKLEKSDKIGEKLKDKKRAVMLFSSITLHNFPEGLAVGVAFGSAFYGIEGATLMAAIILAIGIGIQNFPEGAVISIPLYREGLSKKKSFFYGQLSGIVEPIAGFLGALLVLQARVLLPFLLAFAAGAMIYVVVAEIIPESQENPRKEYISLFTLVGFAIMMILDVALG